MNLRRTIRVQSLFLSNLLFSCFFAFLMSLCVPTLSIFFSLSWCGRPTCIDSPVQLPTHLSTSSSLSPSAQLSRCCHTVLSPQPLQLYGQVIFLVKAVFLVYICLGLFSWAISVHLPHPAQPPASLKDLLHSVCPLHHSWGRALLHPGLDFIGAHFQSCLSFTVKLIKSLLGH